MYVMKKLLEVNAILYQYMKLLNVKSSHFLKFILYNLKNI
jgi:hypothetical protein